MGRQILFMSRIWKRLAFVWITMLFLCSNGMNDVVAQVKNVEQFSISEGLSNSNVTSIFQDSRGFIWIGTLDGLNRYDGYGFSLYRHNPVDSTSIVGNSIQSIVESPNGDIWIGTENSGIAIWKRESGQFHNININIEPFNSLKECGVFGMRAVGDEIWVKTRNYIVSIDQNLKDFAYYGHYSSVFKTGSGNCYPIIPNQNNLWVGSKDGLHQFDLNQKTFNRIAFRSEDLKNEITDLIPLNDTSLVLSTLSEISIFDIKSDVIESVYPNSIWDEGTNINCLLKNNDQIWVGTSDGLLRSEYPYTSFDKYEVNLVGDKELKNITSILIDHSEIMWIGTKQDGLFKIDRKPPKFSSITKSGGEFPFNSYDFESVYVDDENLMWLGTADRGIYCINNERNDFKHYPIYPIYSKDADPTVYAIVKDKNQTIWFGTSNGIFVKKANDNRVIEFDYADSPEFKTLLKSNKVNDILQDQLGNIWFATQFGLYRYNGRSLASFFADDDNEASLCDDNINTLFEDNEGWIWIGTNNGVNIFNVAEENFSRIRNDENAEMKISHNIILSFAQDLDSRIVIGTQSGLSFYDKKNRVPGFYAGNTELTTSKIYSVLIDGYNRIWMSSGKGISFLIKDETLFRFNEKDGVPDFNFNNDASFNNDKELYFAGDKGLTIIRPDSIQQNLNKPEVVITSVSVKQKGKLIASHHGDIEEVEIRYRRNSSVRVEFAAMEFTNPLYNSYKVFLEGYDDNWRPVTNANYVDFSNLSAGTYNLKITGANSDFVWNNEATELSIIIDPPLWMSNYAYAFYVIFGIFLIQTLINYRIRNYRNAYKALQEKADDKKKIEVQKETLSNINQSLTDSISYAKRIQEAMIPSEQMVKAIFNEAFVYFRPKDIVSGDFYWTYRNKDKVFVAAVDCTGHGVPGAFMSIIGFDLLKNIVELQGIECPAKVLNALNAEVVSTFSNNGEATDNKRNVNDGMDLAIISYDKLNGKIEFAGAMNPIYIIRDNEIIVHKGDRFPIGFKGRGEEVKFTKKEIPVFANDIVYLFSDGYADQFGGPEGKKFKYRRFRHLLLNIHKLPIEDQKSILHQKMEEWMGSEHEQIDDILLMGLKI